MCEAPVRVSVQGCSVWAAGAPAFSGPRPLEAPCALPGLTKSMLSDQPRESPASLLWAKAVTRARRTGPGVVWGAGGENSRIEAWTEADSTSFLQRPQGDCLSKLRGQGSCCVTFLHQTPQIMDFESTEGPRQQPSYSSGETESQEEGGTDPSAVPFGAQGGPGLMPRPGVSHGYGQERMGTSTGEVEATGTYL